MKKFMLLLFIALLACPSDTALSAAAPAVKISWNGTPITFTGASPVQEGKTLLCTDPACLRRTGCRFAMGCQRKEAYPVNICPNGNTGYRQQANEGQ